jgi:hypothetical protein
VCGFVVGFGVRFLGTMDGWMDGSGWMDGWLRCGWCGDSKFEHKSGEKASANQKMICTTLFNQKRDVLVYVLVCMM